MICGYKDIFISVKLMAGVQDFRPLAPTGGTISAPKPEGMN
jgi:hypothetical protein